MGNESAGIATDRFGSASENPVIVGIPNEGIVGKSGIGSVSEGIGIERSGKEHADSDILDRI